jgi:hypothetical protein
MDIVDDTSPSQPYDHATTPNPTVERVYGEIKTIIHTRPGTASKSAVTRIAVTCPYCAGVHLHQPIRARLTRPLTYDTYEPFEPASASATTDDTPTTDASVPITYAYLNRHVTHRWFDRKVNWETDRVALCKRGTYHIVGWTEPNYLPLSVQPMRCNKDADAEVVAEWTCHDRHMREHVVPNVEVLEVLRRPHIGRGVMIR